jgi:hypothetical protein
MINTQFAWFTATLQQVNCYFLVLEPSLNLEYSRASFYCGFDIQLAWFTATLQQVTCYFLVLEPSLNLEYSRASVYCGVDNDPSKITRVLCRQNFNKLFKLRYKTLLQYSVL